IEADRATEGKAVSADEPVPSTPEPPSLEDVRARTPARLLVGRSGPAYRTATQLELRRDHAAALDAVRAELDLATCFPPGYVERWGLIEGRRRAGDKAECLMPPDLGRRLDEPGRDALVRGCPAKADLQAVVGDGLSVAAVTAQVPALLPLLEEGAQPLGW